MLNTFFFKYINQLKKITKVFFIRIILFLISTLRKKSNEDIVFYPPVTTVVLNDKVIELRKFKTEDIVAGINRPFPKRGCHYDNKLFFICKWNNILHRFRNFNKLKIKRTSKNWWIHSFRF